MKTQNSPSSSPPIVTSCDVVVAGGGVGGVVTAIAAARHGCRVVLIQDRPVFGGNASSEINVMIAGAGAMGYNKDARETGIIEEILVENSARSADSSCRLLDDVLWEWLNREPGIEFHLNTQVVGVTKDENDRIAEVHALRAGSGQKFTFLCRFVVDATGDAVIAHAAGAPWRMGREAKDEFGESFGQEVADRKVLGCTLPFQFKDTGKPVRYVPPPFARDFSSPDAFPYRAHNNIKWSPWWIEWGGELDMIEQYQEIKDELIKIVYGFWDHLKNHGDHGMENHALIRLSPILGKRESRRVEGPIMLTQHDVTTRRFFPDAVAYGGWPIDLHPPEGIYFPGAPAEQIFVDPYEIPLRCLYSKTIRNLFMVGRDISVSHVALGTTRVMATIATMGQAVGTAIALCRREKVLPAELTSKHIRELQQTLLKDDAYLLGQANEDPADLARTATATATSDAPLHMFSGHSWEVLEKGCAQLFPVTAGRIETLSVRLRNESGARKVLRAVLRRSAHVFDFALSEPVAESFAPIAAGEEDWIAFTFNRELPRGLYWLEMERVPGVSWQRALGEEPAGTKTAQWNALKQAWSAYRGYHIVETAEWVPFRGSHAFRLSPESRPHTADQVLNGIHRAVDWPNAWVSDPEQPLPQSLTLEFPQPVSLGEIQLTFDSELDHRQPPRFPSRTVRHYRLWIRPPGGAEEQLLTEQTDNYQRRRRHEVRGQMARSLRIEILSTNGSPSARIFEVRVYAPPATS
jgi:hypothetical protein